MRYRIAIHSRKKAFPFRFPACQGAGRRVRPTLRRLRTLRTRFVTILPSSKSRFAGKRFAKSTSKSRMYYCSSGKAYRPVKGYTHPDDSTSYPVNAFTLGGIVRDAGLTVEQFRDLL